jgi:ABC-2 type transport system permease protein
MLRDRATLFFALLVPVFELVLFGVIDTTVEDVPTVVLDQSRTQASRALVDELVATGLFRIVGSVESRSALRQEIVAGHAQVGFEIPPEFARRRLAGEAADFLVLIDGSDSTVSSQALSAATGLALTRSLDEALARSRHGEMTLRPHPVMLFNPDSRSANLLIPGLIAILLAFSGTILAAFAIVRERERGTLEQLMVTPVSPLAVVVGKLVPYLVLAVFQLQIIFAVMVWVFRVPVHGSLLLLQGLSVVYLFALLALGLMISSRAKTQAEAIQMAMGGDAALGAAVGLHLSALVAAGADRGAVAASTGDPLHRHLARHRAARRELPRPLGARRGVGRHLRRPRRRFGAGVQEDDRLSAPARRALSARRARGRRRRTSPLLAAAPGTG